MPDQIFNPDTRRCPSCYGFVHKDAPSCPKCHAPNTGQFTKVDPITKIIVVGYYLAFTIGILVLLGFLMSS
jgi:hypothetical protein